MAETRLRVEFERGGTEDFDANQLNIAPDGSLVISKVEVRTSRLAGGQQEVESKIVKVIRRDLWLNVETVELGAPLLVSGG